MYSDVDVVKSRTNIVDLVGAYVRLTKAGSRYKACCPFHQEKTPSFIVNEDRQTYHCFGCGQGGDIFSFVMEMESMGFREALELLADKAGVELQKNPSRAAGGDAKKKMYDALEKAAAFYEKQLHDGHGRDRVLPYLRERGIPDAQIKNFRLGFVPEGWDHLATFLQAQGVQINTAIAAGLLIQKESDGGTAQRTRTYDRFRNRIMFPIRDALGRVIGFTARILPGDDTPAGKYINTPETLLYRKSAVLYGIDVAKQAIKKQDCAVIVEGNMDVIALHGVGIAHAIAVSGTAMTEQHIAAILRYTKNVILFFDADDAGKAAARKSAMACLRDDLHVRMVMLMEGKDAAELAQHDTEQLRTRITDAPHAIDVFTRIAAQTHDLADPHGKRMAIDDVAAVVAQVAHDIEREEWVQKCSAQLDVDEDLFRAAVHSERPGAPPPKPIVPVARAPKPTEELSQIQRIFRSIILMMIAYPHVWEHVYKNRNRYGPLVQQPNIAELLREGPDIGFSVGDYVQKDERRATLYTAALRMQQNYEAQREDGGSPIKDTETYIAVAMEQLQQRKLDQLLEQMQEAEMAGDTDAKRRLLRQITDLTQQQDVSFITEP